MPTTTVSAQTAPSGVDRQIIEEHYTSLLRFVKTSYPPYLVGDIHERIAAELETFAKAVERKESPRLMITVPPRHGKSMLASERFPAWYLGRNPMHSIIATSHTKDLANTFSRRVRGLLNEEWYQALFPARLSADSQAVGDWETVQGGGYRAAGVGTGITGKGCQILIIDDPTKDAKEARSSVVREGVWEWYNSTAYSRLMPGGGVILIMTRWNLDDLAGRLLASNPERWRVVNFPAINEDGEALHPERYSLEYLLELKEQVGPYIWNALYQQNPIADESMPFKAEQFEYRRVVPDDTWRLTLFGDVAYTKKGGDDTAFGLCGINPVAQRHLFESMRAKLDERDSINWLFAKMRDLKGVEVRLEAHSSYHYAVRQRMRTDNLFFPYFELSHKGEKKEDRILARRAYLHVWTYDPATKPDVDQHLNWSPDLSGTVPDDFIDMLAYADRELHWQQAESDYDYEPPAETLQASVWRAINGLK